MKRDNIIEGLTILGKYDKDGYGVCAEHDIIYGGPDSDVVSPEDTKRLEELGWHIDSESGCWAAYV